MACTNCGSNEVELCQCDDGKNSFVISTTNTTIANPMTIAVSNIGQYTGKWALIGQPIFIEGYGTYQVTASTSTSITVAYPPSPYVGGASYSLGSVDYDNSGTIPSGTKISPGGAKGTTGATGSAAGILLYNDVTDSGTTVAVGPQNFAAKSYTLLANTLSVDDNIIEIEAYITLSAVTVDYFHLYFSFGGTDIGHILSQVGTGKSRDFIIKAQISRIGANSQRIIVEARDCDSNFTGVIVPSGIGATQFTGFNTAIDLTIDRVLTINLDKGVLGGGTFGANEGIVRKFTVKNIKQ